MLQKTCKKQEICSKIQQKQVFLVCTRTLVDCYLGREIFISVCTEREILFPSPFTFIHTKVASSLSLPNFVTHPLCFLTAHKMKSPPSVLAWASDSKTQTFTNEDIQGIQGYLCTPFKTHWIQKIKSIILTTIGVCSCHLHRVIFLWLVCQVEIKIQFLNLKSQISTEI